jgi:hypothetical protein
MDDKTMRMPNMEITMSVTTWIMPAHYDGLNLR